MAALQEEIDLHDVPFVLDGFGDILEICSGTEDFKIISILMKP